jgi:ribosome-binding protein aMBF1 (putative translation factor)
MSIQTVNFDGIPYVILPRDEFDQLTALANTVDVPRLPTPDADGNYPAVEYASASLARKIIRDRVAVGLSQRQLATKAGIPAETLCRIETGKTIPRIPTIEKIDRALKQAAKRQKAERPAPRRAKKTHPRGK